jgi:hypothetical protein
MSDIAGELNAVALPIPTEQRLSIYVVRGCDPRAMIEWTKQTGLGEYTHGHSTPGSIAAPFCGVCLFTLGLYGCVTPEQFADIQPFLDRAGKESNVFEYCPHQHNFTRRDPYWFAGRVLVKS